MLALSGLGAGVEEGRGGEGGGEGVGSTGCRKSRQRCNTTHRFEQCWCQVPSHLAGRAGRCTQGRGSAAADWRTAARMDTSVLDGMPDATNSACMLLGVAALTTLPPLQADIKQ